MNKEGTINAIAAMIGIVILTALALLLGHDGILYLMAVGILSGLGGYVILGDLGKIYPKLFFK